MYPETPVFPASQLFPSYCKPLTRSSVFPEEQLEEELSEFSKERFYRSRLLCFPASVQPGWDVAVRISSSVSKFPLSNRHNDASITLTCIYSPSSDILHWKGLNYISKLHFFNKIKQISGKSSFYSVVAASVERQTFSHCIGTSRGFSYSFGSKSTGKLSARAFQNLSRHHLTFSNPSKSLSQLTDGGTLWNMRVV